MHPDLMLVIAATTQVAAQERAARERHASAAARADRTYLATMASLSTRLRARALIRRLTQAA
jgi:hypothetical protein